MGYTPAVVSSLLTDALVDAGIVGIDESIEQPILNRALVQANRMIAQWNHKRWLVYHLVDYAFVSTGALTYTVGAGQNFNINPRPDRIESAFLRQILSQNGQQIDWPISIIPARENYNQIVLKTLGTFAWTVFYDSGWPIGIVHPWPIPQSGIYELHLTFKETLNNFASLQQTVNFPPEYEAALEWNLARRYRASYQMPADPEINALARDALNTIRLANTQFNTLSMPNGVRKNSGISYNIYSDIP